MERIDVEAVEDRTRVEGGHAVILLRGVRTSPRSARFILRALEPDDLPPETLALFEGEHEPLLVAVTEDGISLSIGPEIAASPALLPGTLMEITLPEAGLRGEFVWPAITPLARPKRRNIMTKRSFGETQVVPARPIGDGRFLGTTDTFYFPTLETPVDPGQTPAPVEPDPEAVPAQTPAPTATLAPTPRADPVVRRNIVVTAAQPRIAPTAPPRVAEEPALLAPGLATSENDASQQLDTTHPASRSRQYATSSIAAVTAGVLAAASLIGLRLADLKVVKRTPAALTNTTTAASAMPTPLRSIYDVVAAGPVSPRGATAEGVSPAKALQYAHVFLHGPEAQRDPPEAIYWLKRYLMSGAGMEPARIALTQLGSAYAQPSRGDRDLESAVIAWELAGALGDPVAMCFLAAVHETGLGVPADAVQARSWYQRSTSAGGSCASAETPAAGARK